jgi:hypothetical protein
MTACTQPDCSGTVVDGYCDVCGSPAGAAPFVLAEVAASAGSPSRGESGLAAVHRGSELLAEPKDGDPRAACAQPGCSGGIVDGYCDVCGSPAGAAPFVPAEAPASAASPAPGEPGLTAPPEPKNGGLRAACTQPGCTGTIVVGYCDVCGSPAGAAPFVPAGSAASPAPAAAPDLPEADVTVDSEPVPDVEVTVVSEPVPATARPRGLTAVRRGALVAAVLLLLGCAVLLYQVAPGFLTYGSRPSPTASSGPTTGDSQGVRPSRAPASASRSAASEARSGSAERGTIQLEDLADSARPFETVRIHGTYRGGPKTFLRVQRLERGMWLDFPVPTKTNQSGQFTTYVELEQPGRYWLRVVEPGSAVTSKPFVLVIEG